MDTQTGVNPTPKQPKKNWHSKSFSNYWLLGLLLLVLGFVLYQIIFYSFFPGKVCWAMGPSPYMNPATGEIKNFSNCDNAPPPGWKLVNGKQNSDAGPANNSSDNLFFAKLDGKVLSVAIYDPGTGQFNKTRNINLEDYIATLESGSVQFNDLTGDIFFSTSGIGGLSPSDCTNKDGTCDFRIQKVNIDTGVVTKLYNDSTGQPNQWLLDKKNNALYLFTNTGPTLQVTKIDIRLGNVTIILNQKNNQNLYFDKLQISADGQQLFASCNNAAATTSKDIYARYLCRIDLVNGKLAVDLITPDTSAYSVMSPDEKYLGFYTGHGVVGTDKLYVYDLPNQKLIAVPYTGQSLSERLLWSKDSSKIFYNENALLKYYDISNGSVTTIKNSLANPLSISDSNNYLFYSLSSERGDGPGIINLDTKQDTILTSQPFLLNSNTGIVDTEWY